METIEWNARARARTLTLAHTLTQETWSQGWTTTAGCETVVLVTNRGDDRHGTRVVRPSRVARPEVSQEKSDENAKRQKFARGYSLNDIPLSARFAVQK